MPNKKLLKNKAQKKYWPVLFIFLGFLALLNFTTLVTLVKFFISPRYWNEKTLMAGIFLYLFYLQFKKTKFIFKPTYQVRYLLLAMATIIIGSLSGTDFLLWLGLGVSIFSILIYFFGSVTAGNFILVLMFLLFLGRINSPTALSYISLYLRLISTKIAGMLLNLVGIATQAQGSYLLTKNFACTVSEACNGLNNLVSLLYLTLVFCYLQRIKLKNSLILLVSAVVLAIFANSLRIMTIVVIGYFYGAKIVQPDSFIHILVGIIYFIFAVTTIFYINKLLEKK